MPDLFIVRFIYYIIRTLRSPATATIPIKGAIQYSLPGRRHMRTIKPMFTGTNHHRTRLDVQSLFDRLDFFEHLVLSFSLMIRIEIPSQKAVFIHPADLDFRPLLQNHSNLQILS